MKWGKEDSGLLKPGDIFEKYTVEKLLGRGGMGAVYLVRHNILDSLFALKVLFPEVASKNKRFVDRFIREVIQANGLAYEGSGYLHWEGLVCLEKLGKCDESHRTLVKQWLESNGLQQIEISELFDIWLDYPAK